MQSLINKNEELKKDIEQLKTEIAKLKKTPIYRKTNKKKKPSKNKKSMFGTMRGLIGGKDDKKHEKLTPQQADAVTELHDLLLEESYEAADTFIENHKKLLFGKTKKGDGVPTAFSLVDEFGESVLMKAIKEGQTDLALKWIEKNSADVDVVDREGHTALMVGAMFGDEEIVASLVKNANRDAKTKYSKKTALHFAAEQGHLTVVKVLLENGCDCVLEDNRGRKAFQLATNKAVKEEIKSVMTRQGNGPTPEEEELELEEEEDVHNDTKERSYSQDEEMKPLFVENDRLKNQKKKLTLLRNDLKKKTSPEDKLDKLLNMDKEQKMKYIQRGQVDDRVKQYLGLVLKGDSDDALEKIEALLTEKRKEFQINKDATDEFEETALMKAARLGFEEVLSLLLLYKCNTEVKDVEGYTALMKAAQFGKIECVLKLIAEGADLNASSMKGKLTALMLAAERGHADICELLIAEGADHGFLNSDGNRAVDLAKLGEAKQRIEKAMDEHPVSRPPIMI